MKNDSTETTVGISTQNWKTASNDQADGRLRALQLVSDSARASGEDFPSSLINAENRATGVGATPNARSGRSRATLAPVPPKVQHLTRATLAACIEDLDRAIDDGADFFARNNALEQMRAKLTILWDLRSQREEAFAEFVNMVQSIFLKRRVEDFMPTQLLCLRNVLEKTQQQSQFDDEFVNELTTELLNGGIDVFREID